MSSTQPQRQRTILVTEEHPIAKPTVPVLLAAIEAALRERRVERLVYTRGRPTFTVERLVPEVEVAARGEDASPAGDMDAFLTPFEMIRQHAEVVVIEAGSLLEAIAAGVQDLHERGARVTMIVTSSLAEVRERTPRGLKVEAAWQVPIYEDPDTRGALVFVAGCADGSLLLRDVTTAAACVVTHAG